MKKVIFGLIATVVFGLSGNAQNIRDFSVKSQTSISKDSEDSYYKSFVANVNLPAGVNISDNETFTLYTLKNENFKMIEVPILSDKSVVNFMFVILDLKQNTSMMIFKNHQKGNYEFFDENLVKTYSFAFTDVNIEFINEAEKETKPKQTCYQKCRAAAYAEIESDWLSDLACSFNPCGAAIAIYCGIQCR